MQVAGIDVSWHWCSSSVPGLTARTLRAAYQGISCLPGFRALAVAAEVLHER